MDEVIISVIADAPVAAIGIFAIYRMSTVMMVLAQGLVDISKRQNVTLETAMGSEPIIEGE